MRTSSNKKPSRRHDRKVLVAEESTKSWADSDSESSSSSSSSCDSEQEEVHCLMANQTSDDEVFDFSNVEFTREDLVQALNDMVHEYKTLSHTFEEIKAENASLKNSSAESSSDELEDTDSLKTELSRLKIENDLLRNEASELKAEVDKLTKEMSSWNQSTRSLHYLSAAPSLLSKSRRRRPPCAAAAAARLRRKIVSGQFDEDNPFVLISSVLLVQADEGVSFLVMDRIGDIYHNLPRRADVIVTTVGAMHKCQQDRDHQIFVNWPPAAAACGGPSHAHIARALACACRAHWPRLTAEGFSQSSCDLDVWSSAGRRSWSARLRDDACAGRVSGRTTAPHDCSTPCVHCCTLPRRLCDDGRMRRRCWSAMVRIGCASFTPLVVLSCVRRRALPPRFRGG
ncbi:hypothetical protein F511_27626 [Dorcoceras hygrometricum]|uniref:Uncharacterized protein n=1 Tax=Dorcoceras hygrometricum TaxID=472368 RepID=A0A2Z7B1G5_9LAMI|nr:hypothetical protein F511_27626 [Dorcoceras hygrometricum]